MRWVRLRRWLPGVAFLLALPLGAQQPVRQPTTGTITGVVLDATRNVGIAGAMIVLDGRSQGTLSDSLGAFELKDVPAGEELLTVRQYGYQEVGALVTVTAGEALVLDVPLVPDPEMLDGITVVADRLVTMERRLTGRRNAAPVAARAYDRESLFRSAAWDLLEYLQMDAFLHTTPCGRTSMSSMCVWRRGRPVAPRIFIDEMPVNGGLEQLSTYRPHDLYLLEVYSSGQEIRAYTHQFMERMARRPMMLIPVWLP